MRQDSESEGFGLALWRILRLFGRGIGLIFHDLARDGRAIFDDALELLDRIDAQTGRGALEGYVGDRGDARQQAGGLRKAPLTAASHRRHSLVLLEGPSDGIELEC